MLHSFLCPCFLDLKCHLFKLLPSTSWFQWLIIYYHLFCFLLIKVTVSIFFPAENGRQDENPSLLELPSANSEAEPQPLVSCSSHMCPIQVHWHVKQNYREYWRVKITITNLNYVKNYSQWNLVMLHPNFRNINQVFSFNYKPLDQYGTISKLNETYAIITNKTSRLVYLLKDHVKSLLKKK